MNKKFLLFLVAIGIATLYLIGFDKIVYKEFLSLKASVQSFYLNSFVYVGEVVSKYFNQLNQIEKLTEQNKQNETYRILYEQAQSELEKFEYIDKVQTIDKNNFEKVPVLSYLQFNDLSKVILDYDSSITEESIKALVTYEGYSAGIVLEQKNKPIALLNNNPKCNYTVFIGEQKNPGITSGMNQKGQLLIKYVPIWEDVNIDDEVITSSLDNIFPYGIKVGKVIDYEVKDNMQLVFVQPYANALSYEEFFIYKKEYNINTTQQAQESNSLPK
jgi:rod shape-determining protein MreC